MSSLGRVMSSAIFPSWKMSGYDCQQQKNEWLHVFHSMSIQSIQTEIIRLSTMIEVGNPYIFQGYSDIL